MMNAWMKWKQRGANSSEKDKTCGDIADYHNAGFVATIMLVFGSLALFVATSCRSEQ